MFDFDIVAGSHNWFRRSKTLPTNSGLSPRFLTPLALPLRDDLDRGLEFHQQGKLAEAERIYRKVLRRRPQNFDALHLLGVIAIQTKRSKQAITLIRKAITLRPDYAEAYYNCGNALRDLKRAEEALASYDKAVALKSDYAEAFYNRGIILTDLKRPDEALASYHKAIELKPNYPEAYVARGAVLMDLKRPDAASASYDKAIELKPDYVEAHLNQSLALLLMGRFEQGLRQYELRHQHDESKAARSYPQPLWLGQDNIAGKTLFIYWEQGLGDTIQFCRYAKLLEARGAKIIMSVQQPLIALLKQLSPTIQIIGPDDVPNDFDYHCPLLSLPLAFGTTLQTIPTEHHYLAADEELPAAWSARLRPKTKPRIGIVWSGDASHRNDHNRSMLFEQFVPLCV
jgi:hypothetical protein